MMDGHVAATMGEEWSAQRIGQLCARTKLVHQVETIIVVTMTAVLMVDLESVVSKQAKLRKKQDSKFTRLKTLTSMFK